MAMSGRQARYAVLVAAALWACNRGSEKPADQPPARDLSLAPAESVAQMNDRPTDKPATQSRQPERTQPKTTPSKPAPEKPVEVAKPKAPEPAKPLMAGEGTRIDLVAHDTITSRTHKKGEAISATTASAVTDPTGRTVIPAGAVFSGTISDIAPAEHPGGQGRMVLTFNRVSFGGKNYAVEAKVDTLGTVMKGRGVTAGDAAKVGAGAVVGGIAGRLLGGNKTGTIVGAVAGTAAGAGVAAATRDVDIILPAGALVRIVLTAPFELKEIAE